MKFIDAHCHLQDQRIAFDHEPIIQSADTVGIKYMACCSTKEKDWQDVQKLSLKNNSVIPSYGIHPWFIDNLALEWQKRLASLLKAEKNRLKGHFLPSVGEAGLDFTIKSFDRSLQVKIFTGQLILAKELGLPISIHIRKAWDIFIHIIKKMGALPANGLIHSYSGSADMIPILEKYGFYISFSGSITRPGAKKVINALKAVSDNRILIETDSPDILPSMLDKNEYNTPANLVYIAEIASQIKRIPVQELVRKTYNNGVRLFKISEK